MRCEDFPCCGHEAGCCPDYDPETGEQTNMVCTCGAKLPITSRYSICQGCLNRPEDGDPYYGEDYSSKEDMGDEDDVLDEDHELAIYDMGE